MNIPTVALRAGVRRGRTEFGNSMRTPADITYYIVGTAVFLLVMFLNRNNPVEGTGLTTAVLMFPGVLGLVIVFAATYGLATQVSTEREDGTLLRAKAVPHGMAGYVAGHVTRVGFELLLTITLLAVPATLLLDSLWHTGVAGILHAVAIFLLGALACIPLGFMIGSIFRNPRSVGGWGFLIMGALIISSGIFAPLGTLPGWVHPIAQVLPLYWLGLGMRAALLPDAAVAVELGESWRVLETFAVLGGWALLGLLLAPVLLRRMARRESGSAVSERRQTALQRV